MSLLRLLTTGKSLVGVKDTESRYRLTSQRLLPQFGPARNPFRDRGRPNTAEAEACSLGDHGGSEASGDKHTIPPVKGQPTPALRGMAGKRAHSARSHATCLAEALRLRAVALLGRWKTGMRRWPGRPSGKPAKPAIPLFTSQPVQGALSLDKIEVVRNDLSDADLELVSAKQPVARASAAPDVRAEERADIGEGTRGRVTTRVFGPGET